MEFEESVEAALESLPDDLREAMSNVAIVVEDEPPPGSRYSGCTRGSRSPPHELVRRCRAGQDLDLPRPARAALRHDPELLERKIRRVVLHEIAHHFGISDERLVELDRY